jgi:hypothetical protein
MEISLSLAELGAKKIKLTDPLWVVKACGGDFNIIEIMGAKYSIDKEGLREIIGSRFSIWCLPNKKFVRAQRKYITYDLSFYDAIDWIISGTTIPAWYNSTGNVSEIYAKSTAYNS